MITEGLDGFLVSPFNALSFLFPGQENIFLVLFDSLFDQTGELLTPDRVASRTKKGSSSGQTYATFFGIQSQNRFLHPDCVLESLLSVAHPPGKNSPRNDLFPFSSFFAIIAKFYPDLYLFYSTSCCWREAIRHYSVTSSSHTGILFGSR